MKVNYNELMSPFHRYSSKEVSSASLLIFVSYPESGIDVGLAPYALLLSWKQDSITALFGDI
jgi:hypothetical protein